MDSYGSLAPGVRLGVDPHRTVIVVGPQLTADCLKSSDKSAFLSYREIVEDGIQFSLDLERFGSNAERDHKERLLHSAYELEPTFAAYKVEETMRNHGRYEQWLKELFQTSTMQSLDGSHESLQHLQALQRQGVRLAYTHYDEMIATALGVPVVVMEDEEGVRRWAQGFPSLLHLHGAISNLSSLKLACLCYKTAISSHPSAQLVQEQFHSKTVVLVGMAEPHHDPLLPKLLDTYASPPANLPVLINHSTNPPPAVNSMVLSLPTETSDGLPSSLSINSLPLARSG